jgi:dynein intermediate chain
MDSKARREEIEAKKAKLLELKRSRALREQELKSSRQAAEGSDLAQPVPSRADKQKDIDALLSTVLGDSRPGSTGPRVSGSPARHPSRSRPTSVLSSRPLSGERSASGPRVSGGSGEQDESQVRSTGHSESIYVAAATQTLSIAPLVTVYEEAAGPQRPPTTYSKAVQTSDEWQPQRQEHGIGEAEDGEWDDNGERPLTRRERERQEQIRQELRREIEEELRVAMQPMGDTAKNKDDERFPARTLTDEEFQAVISSSEFEDFVDQSTKIIERALDEPYDLLTDYTEAKTSLDEEEDGYGAGRGRRGRRVKEVGQFWDERWSKKRMISDIAFSTKYPELLLASYTKNPSAPHDPAGILQIWNDHMPSRPEYIFHASSDILAAKFSPFHPSLLVGGCYSGQVLVWDTRSKSHTPVQKTPLTGTGHAHPVYSIDLVGTQNANNIISCSTDGVVCSWSIDMLASPQEYLELLAPPPAKSEDVAPLCMAFPQADPTYFLAGTEEGTIYACHRYERAGAKAGIDARIRYAGHAAPVTALDFHPVRGAVDLGDLVLSASMDWSVKVWRVRPPAAMGGTAPGAASVQTPVLDIPREDLVYDAKWSPVRPGIFACVDGSGALEIWDVNADIEVPVARVVPKERSTAGWLKRSLNKCAWEKNEGKKIAVGGLDGQITVYEVGSELGGLEGAKTEEWAMMKKVVGRAEAQIGAKATVNGNGR